MAPLNRNISEEMIKKMAYNSSRIEGYPKNVSQVIKDKARELLSKIK